MIGEGGGRKQSGDVPGIGYKVTRRGARAHTFLLHWWVQDCYLTFTAGRDGIWGARLTMRGSVVLGPDVLEKEVTDISKVCYLRCKMTIDRQAHLRYKDWPLSRKL